MNCQRTKPAGVLLAAAAFVLAASIAAPAGPAAAGPKTTAQAIEGGVTCQCGCNMTVSGCNHEGCSSKAEMQAMAEKEVASGKDATTILQDFVLRYGTKVLATPPPSGFNLTVWILPILGGILGLTLVVMVVRRWRRPLAEPTESAAVDPTILAEVEEEMKKLG